MTPSALTSLQREAVATLVEQARLTTSPVDVAKAETAARGFDVLRNTRNQLRYGAKQTGTAESGFAIETATALLAQARTAIQ